MTLPVRSIAKPGNAAVFAATNVRGKKRKETAIKRRLERFANRRRLNRRRRQWHSRLIQIQAESSRTPIGGSLALRPPTDPHVAQSDRREDECETGEQIADLWEKTRCIETMPSR